ncbi:hypothetical protein LTR12_018317, partial [Friedmanniomyces endolithicus]
MPTHNVQRPVAKLDKQRQDIERFFQQDVAYAVGHTCQLTDLDTHRTKARPEDRFRKGLLQCTLAKGFSDWQRSLCGNSRLDQLQADPSVRADNQNRACEPNGSTLRDFLRCADIAPQYNVLRAISAGQKLLALKQTVKTQGIAYTPILFFCERQLVRLKNRDLGTLVDQLDPINWIRDLAVDRLQWYLLCKSQYAYQAAASLDLARACRTVSATQWNFAPQNAT